MDFVTKGYVVAWADQLHGRSDATQIALVEISEKMVCQIIGQYSAYKQILSAEIDEAAAGSENLFCCGQKTWVHG